MILISRRISPRFSTSFWPPRLWDLAEILLEILLRFSASVWPPRFWDLSEYLGEFLAAKILRSRQDLGKNLDEILRSRRDLGEILGEFLAAKTFRSRQQLGENLDEILRSRRESRRAFGRRDFEISARSRSKFCKGGRQSVCQSSKLKFEMFARLNAALFTFPTQEYTEAHAKLPVT